MMEEEEEEEEGEAVLGRSPASQDEKEEGRSFAFADELQRIAPSRRTRDSRLKAQESSADSAASHVPLDRLASSSWIFEALAFLQGADLRIATSRTELDTHPSPSICIPDLCKVRTAAMALVGHIDNAMLYAQCRQGNLEKNKLCVMMVELAQRQHAALSEQATEELKKQGMLFQEEKEALISSHMLEREALIDRHAQEKKDLQRELEKEREKSVCVACHDKIRDTIIFPCLHFQYCFSCLLQLREANSNTCPTCRAPIQGLNMSKYRAVE